MNKNAPEVTAKQKTVMLTALQANYGNVSKAAKLANINPVTHYRWMKEDIEYARATENLRDISYRGRRERLIELAFNKAEKGNITVLNKLLGIFFKDLTEEMRILRLNNDIGIRAKIKWVNTPVDPTRIDHLLNEEQREEMERMIAREDED